MLAGIGVLIAATMLGETPETHTYKRVGELEIKLDVYPSGREEKRPVVVWIHGGALINGHRASVSGRLRTHCKSQGYSLVSLDYRLAPETQLPEIIADVEDAFRWIRKQGPELFQADPERIAVMGGSAGGYLTLTAGFRVRPRPQVLVSYWGYGDLVGDWYSSPSPFPRHHRSQLSEEEAWQQVSGPPISDARQRQGDGGAFYQFCRQRGVWPAAVSGWDAHVEPEKFFPFMPVKNVTQEYPPTLMIHGTTDTDVPHEQSVLMAEQFEAHGVAHRLISIQGGEHGLGGGDPAKIEAAHQAALAYLDEYLDE